jgi:hypothetical protein
MPEKLQQNQNRATYRLAVKRLWPIVTFIIIAAIGCLLLWKTTLSKRQAINKQLAAIEAARAIPDPENAAILYDKLFESLDIDSNQPEFFAQSSHEPWLSKDHPETAEWLKGHQKIIDTLMEISRIENCRFPITAKPAEGRARGELRDCVFLLRSAVNNDMAEGRINATLEKYLCLIQMANHLYQQPLIFDYLVGMAVEAISLHPMASFIVQGDANEAHLKTIEAIPFQMKNTWSTDLTQMLEVERLLDREFPRELNSLERLRYWWYWHGSRDRAHKQYLRLLTCRRGIRILIELRHYKNQTGHWPESLDQIKQFVPAEVLVDPHNESANGGFVYKLTDDGFKLYSKGQNGVDEDGQHKDEGPDDWPIWPPRGRKPKTEEGPQK